MNPTWNLQRLDVRAFARAGATLSGHAAWAELPRLQAEQTASGAEPIEPAESIEPVEPAAPVESAVVWHLSGQVKDLRGGAHQIWLRVQARASLRLVCQRCLEPMNQALQVDRAFRFVSSEHEAQSEDDQSEEDVLVASSAFDALSLVEDELILALPLVPRHPDCQPPA